MTLVIGLAVSVSNELFGTQQPAGQAHLPGAPRQLNPLIQSVSFGWLLAGQSLYAGGFLRTEVYLAPASPHGLPRWFSAFTPGGSATSQARPGA